MKNSVLKKLVVNLMGVFSLIVYNDNTKKLYKSRDPYGVRPLFIGYNNLEELFLIK